MWAMLLVGAVVALIFFSSWWFSAHQRTLRAMRKVERCSIAGAPDGAMVRITGTLGAGPRVLRAPLSGRSCAGYWVQVQYRGSNGSETSEWYDLIDEREVVDFVVEDGSGSALVQTREVELAIVLDHERSGTFGDATPVEESFLRRHGHGTTGQWGINKTLRYREAVLEPGETVVVVGRARWEEDPEPGAAQRTGYRGGHRPRRLVLEAPPRAPLRVSDDLMAHA